MNGPTPHFPPGGFPCLASREGSRGKHLFGNIRDQIRKAVLMIRFRFVFTWTFLTLAGLWWPSAGYAANLVVNGEFTDGVEPGWETVGTVFNTGQTGVLSDQGGAYVVLFQSVPVPVELAQSLTLQFDLFGNLSPVAGLGQTPDTLFSAVFLGVVPFGPEFGAGVYDEVVPVLDLDFRGLANPAPGLAGEPGPQGEGWTRYRLPLDVTGFVTVAFEFIDGNGIVGDSTGAVDNVILEVVPIPETGTVVLLGAAGVAALLRRRDGFLNR